VISSGEFRSGYSLLFALGSVFFLLAAGLGDVKTKERIKIKDGLLSFAKQVLSNSKMLKILLSETIGGFTINGALARLVLPLLILEKTGTEFGLGRWLSFIALVSIANSLVVGKKLHYKKYDKSIIWGTGLTIVSLVWLMYRPSMVTFVLFGVIKGLATSLIYIPKRVYSENLLLTINGRAENQVDYLMIREVFNIGLGRLWSYVLLLFSPNFLVENLGLYFSLIIMAVIVQALLLTSIKYSKVEFEG